jgi:hypothetical protein
MRNSPAINAVAVVATLASAVGIWFGTGPRYSQSDARLQSELGRALAQEAVQLGTPTGKILVILRDSDAFPSPSTETALAGFTKELQRAGRGEPILQRMQTDPLRPLQVPGGDFAELLRKGGPGDVVVSFMGPPNLTPEKKAALGGIRAKVVAFCPGSIPEQMDLRQLADAGLLHSAILNRPATGSGAMKAKPRADSFDDLYVRASLAELSARSPISVAQ